MSLERFCIEVVMGKGCNQVLRRRCGCDLQESLFRAEYGGGFCDGLRDDVRRILWFDVSGCLRSTASQCDCAGIVLRAQLRILLWQSPMKPHKWRFVLFWKVPARIVLWSLRGHLTLWAFYGRCAACAPASSVARYHRALRSADSKAKPKSRLLSVRTSRKVTTQISQTCAPGKARFPTESTEELQNAQGIWGRCQVVF